MHPPTKGESVHPGRARRSGRRQTTDQRKLMPEPERGPHSAALTVTALVRRSPAPPLCASTYSARVLRHQRRSTPLCSPVSRETARLAMSRTTALPPWGRYMAPPPTAPCRRRGSRKSGRHAASPGPAPYRAVSRETAVLALQCPSSSSQASLAPTRPQPCAADASSRTSVPHPPRTTRWCRRLTPHEAHPSAAPRRPAIMEGTAGPRALPSRTSWTPLPHLHPRPCRIARNTRKSRPVTGCGSRGGTSPHGASTPPFLVPLPHGCRGLARPPAVPALRTAITTGFVSRGGQRHHGQQANVESWLCRRPVSRETTIRATTFAGRTTTRAPVRTAETDGCSARFTPGPQPAVFSVNAVVRIAPGCREHADASCPALGGSVVSRGTVPCAPSRLRASHPPGDDRGVQ